MLKSLRPEAKNKEKMQETSCERAELVARVESRSHHHVDRWILEKPQLARGRATEQCCMARWNHEQRDDNAILGQDPMGPLAPLGGPELLLHPAPPKW